MQVQGRLRLAAYLAPPLAVLVVATVVACRDALTSDTKKNDAAVTSRPSISDAARRARASLHRKNELDWVGVAHNRAIDDLRKELRKPGVFSRRMCEYVADYALRPERLPVERRSSTIVPQAGREGNVARLCRNTQATILRPASYSNTSAQDTEISAAANQLLLDIFAGIDGATNSFDLATRLQPILEATAGLNEVDQVAISVTIAVAQNSLEYWESELPLLQQEVVSEYGGCANQAYVEGYSSGDAYGRCVDGGGGSGGDVVERPRNLSSPSPPIRYVLSDTRECPLYHHWIAMIRTARADADGAASGYIAGMVTTKVPAAAAGYALAGGVTKSAIEAIKATWKLYWCAMGGGERT